MLSDVSVLEQRDVTPWQQRGMWAALHPSCIHMYVVYMEHLRLEQLINAQLYLSISSTFFLIHEEPAEVQGMLLSRLDWAAVPVSNSTKYMVWERCPGLWPLRGPVWVFDCAFSSTSYSGTQLALFCTGVGQFQASLRFIGLGSDRAIVCSLTGKCSWRQAVELSVGVKTSLVLEAWDIHHSICTGKRRGNSCKSKEYGTSLQPTL